MSSSSSSTLRRSSCPVSVVIEYCDKCDYGPLYQELSDLIRSMVPGAKVAGFIGRRMSFEVRVNDVLVHSKLKIEAFPDFEEVAKIVRETNEGDKPRQVTKIKK